MIKKDLLLSKFNELTPDEILALSGNRWGDDALLDVVDELYEQDDEARAEAVQTILLRSADHSPDMLEYAEIYENKIIAMNEANAYAETLCWAYAALTYSARHAEDGVPLSDNLEIFDAYFNNGEIEVAIKQATRLIRNHPNHIWLYDRIASAYHETAYNWLAIELLERGLKIGAEDDPADIRSRLEHLHQSALEYNGEQEELPDAVVAALRDALKLDQPLDSDGDWLTPLDDLTANRAEIVAEGKVLAAELIEMAFGEDESADVAAAILRDLALPADNPPMPELRELQGWLTNATGEWRDLLTDSIGKIDIFTAEQLKEMAADRENLLFVRTSAVKALTKLAENRPEIQDDVREFLHHLITRDEAINEADEEEFVTMTIGEIVDWGEKSFYPLIEQAFADDRLDPSHFDIQWVQQKWGLPVTPRPERDEDEIHIKVICKVCGRCRVRYVRHVLVDIATEEKEFAGEDVPYGSHIIDQPFVCAKCGARDRYELETLSKMRLTFGQDPGALARAISGEGKFDPSKNKLVSRMRMMAFDGEEMHPFEALNRYNSRIAGDPKNSELYFRKGNMLRTLRRSQEAIEAYKRGYELGYKSAEGILNYAMAVHDFTDDRRLAKSLYKETIKTVNRARIFPTRDDLMLLSVARDGLRSLRKRESSPYQLPTMGQDDVVPLKQNRRRR